MALGGSSGGAGSGAIRAGRAFVEFFGKDAGVNTFISGLQKRLRSTSRFFTQVGAGMLGVAGGGGMAALVGAMNSLGDMSRMKAVADAFGMTGEAASGLFGMLAMNGGEFKEDMEGMTQFSTRITDALNGVGGATGDAAKLFQGLSVSAKDLVGLPLDEQFFRVHEAIRELPQGLQSSRLALIGGTDSLKKWLPLLGRSTAELREQAKASSVSAEDLKQAQEATMAYQRATLALTQVWRKVAVAVAPVIEQIANWATTTLRPLVEFVDRNRTAVVAVAATITGVAALGAAFIGLGAALSGASAVISLAVGVISFMATPLGLAVTATVALGAALAYLLDVGGSVRSTFGGIVDALSVGNLALAWKVALAGMKAEWAGLVENVTKIWNDFSQGFQEGWASAVYLFKSIWADGLESVGTGFTGLLTHLKTNYSGFFKFLFDQWASLEDLVGDPAVAEGLRLMTTMPAAEFERTMKGVDKEIKADAQKRRNDASKELDAAKARIAAENAGRLAGVAADKQAADQLLNNLRLGAAIAASMRGKGAGAAGPQAPPGLAAAMGAVRGQFAGFGSLSASLGGSGPTREVTKRLDKLVEKTDDEIEVMQEVVRNTSNLSGGVVWGV